jgi:hypothetical protein
MKKVLRVTIGSLAIASLSLVGTTANAQCTVWVEPTPTTAWTDFNAMGGAPCDPGTGCPVNEITAFEIFADEAYQMMNINVGGTYTFSACNGVGGTAWPISFTIITPGGEVDAHGLDEGSICALTWTATESGTYTIVVSEAGVACGESTNQATNNGNPAITCSGGGATACPSGPANDMCANAIMLDLNANCVAIPGNTNNATQELPPATCDGETSNSAREVWYSLVAEGPEHGIVVAGEGMFDAIVELFSGTCGSLNSLTCVDANFPTPNTPATETLNYSNFVVGDTYYMRVYRWNQAANSTGHTFQICAVNTVVGINELDRNAFSVFPNPTDGNITITGHDVSGNVQVELTDMTGRLVHSINRQMVAGQQITLDLEGKLVAGTYHIVLTTSAGRVVKPVIVR